MRYYPNCCNCQSPISLHQGLDRPHRILSFVIDWRIPRLSLSDTAILVEYENSMVFSGVEFGLGCKWWSLWRRDSIWRQQTRDIKPNYYLNQCWLLVNCVIGNKRQWNVNKNRIALIRGHTLENVVWKMPAIWLMSQSRRNLMKPGRFSVIIAFLFLSNCIYVLFKIPRNFRKKHLMVIQNKHHLNYVIKISTLYVRGPSYLGLTRSISWLLLPWLLTSPGHQQPWYWLRRICTSWFYLRKDFKYLCHISVE